MAIDALCPSVLEQVHKNNNTTIRAGTTEMTGARAYTMLKQRCKSTFLTPTRLSETGCKLFTLSVLTATFQVNLG